jgi:ubiquinol-cytochrome c reductase iron-sulfur subunit
MKILRWLAALVLRRWLGSQPPSSPVTADPEPIVPPGRPDRGAENLVLVFLGLAVVCALGFIVAYALLSPTRLPTSLLGIALGGALLSCGAALAVVAKRLVVTEQLEDDYPTEHPRQQRETAQILHDGGSRITRKRLLLGASATAGGALALAAATPALSLGPIWDTTPLDQTPWRRGTRLVDESGRPMAAADVTHQSFYTAFPEHADPDQMGAPLVVVRLDPDKLRLPAGRAGWAPEGILAFSKICTHAACAVALYRNPKFPTEEPHPALVCPCHYSTFDPFTGGTVTYGPAGRPLPQLPLMIDATGHLRAAGNFSGRVGPAWLNVRKPPSST